MVEQDGTGMGVVLGWNGDECWSRMVEQYGTAMGGVLGWNGDEAKQ